MDFIANITLRMTMNKFHFNEHKQDWWKCDWLIGHIISITLTIHAPSQFWRSSTPPPRHVRITPRLPPPPPPPNHPINPLPRHHLSISSPTTDHLPLSPITPPLPPVKLQPSRRRIWLSISPLAEREIWFLHPWRDKTVRSSISHGLVSKIISSLPIWWN